MTTRRNFVKQAAAGAVAATIGIATAEKAQGAGISPELQRLFDSYFSLKADFSEIGDRLEAIEDSPLRPATEIRLSECVAHPENLPPAVLSRPLYLTQQIDDIFTAANMSGANELDTQNDFLSALELMETRAAAEARWLADSGCEALREEEARIGRELTAAEGAIFRFQCRSQADREAKIRFFVEHMAGDFGDTGSPAQLVDFVVSLGVREG